MEGMRENRKNPGKKPTGSTTNASDAVDDVILPPEPSTDELVDEAVKETFPASDPIAVGDAAEKADREPEPRQTDLQPKPRRSPDWLLHPPRRG